MIVQQALREGVVRLTEAGIEGAARDARWLMAGCLNIEVGRLIAISLGACIST